MTGISLAVFVFLDNKQMSIILVFKRNLVVFCQCLLQHLFLAKKTGITCDILGELFV